MEPGDMVLYESHSTIHGRPFPLKGRYFANIFVHFEPTGHTLRHHNHETNAGEDVDQKYRDSMKQKLGGHENQQHDNGLPSYILTGSPESERWQQNHPSVGPIVTEGSTVAHKAAQNGDLGKLKIEVDAKKHLLSAKDEHGWQPIHEGARGGHIDVVRYLVENGADINAKTTVIGGTALYYAKQEFKNDHPVVAFLESLGAVDIGPDL
jgi:prolyl 4-hydroxylase